MVFFKCKNARFLKFGDQTTWNCGLLKCPLKLEAAAVLRKQQAKHSHCSRGFHLFIFLDPQFGMLFGGFLLHKTAPKKHGTGV